MELKCAIQQYEWGKDGADSKVAQLYKSANPEIQLNSKPYAELWMGTHPNGPSKVKASNEYLLDVLAANPTYIGLANLPKHGHDIPFILKVLSIKKALSIQAHPDKKLAEHLYKTKPNIYKDANHKPELAIALTPFEALIGFRPILEIQEFFRKIPELCNICGEEYSIKLMNVSKNIAMQTMQVKQNRPETILEALFTTLMKCDESVVKQQLQSLLGRLKRFDVTERNANLAELIERLYQQYPNDVGCFAPYFLNVLILKENEAIYLGPNEPHAYLSGDCIECMAASDNVIRAGLTPKLKDIDTLCSMLNYKGTPARVKLFRPFRESQYIDMFKPPIPDFAVAKIVLGVDDHTFTMPQRSSASIVICVRGTATFGNLSIVPGTVIFIPVNQVNKIKDNFDGLLLFQAMSNYQ